MWKDPEHPIWKLLASSIIPLVRTAVILVVLLLVLWLNAEHFDETEIRTVITMFIAILGAEGVTNAFSKAAKQ